MLSVEFLSKFKRETEMKWLEKSMNPNTHGFQFQAGTGWCPGLSDEQILAYENDVNIRFPSDFKMLLRLMNGTNLPTLNIYGSSGKQPDESVGVYAYPRDLGIVRLCIDEANKDRDALAATMAEQGFTLTPAAKLMPIYAHRCVVCDDEEDGCAVLSIWDPAEAIVYGYTLEEYLEREFLGKVLSWAS